MLLPHAGRPGVQRWDQGSLVTFASTGAVQPLTCCRVEFPPLGCTGRKLLSTNGSSLFLFLSEHWTGRKGEEGICQIKKGSYKPPFCSCAPPAQAAKKKALLATPIQAVDGRSQKGRRTSPCFLLPLQQSPPSPGVVFGKGGRCSVGFNQSVPVDGVRAPSCRSCTKVPSNAITRGFSLTSLCAATRETLGMMPLTVTSSSPLAKAAGKEEREGGTEEK